LFVTNGHGEASIAARIARDVRALAPLATDHLALVGERLGSAGFPDVGPQRAMPSGGLVAMGNVRAFARDLGAGWLGLFAGQLRFLRSLRGRYAAVIAVGDAYAAALTRLAAYRGRSSAPRRANTLRPTTRSSGGSSNRQRGSSYATARRPKRCAGKDCGPKRPAT